MFGYEEGYGERPLGLGSRRLGGPILFSDLWPALREELREVYVARRGPARLGTLPRQPGTAYPDHWSGADALT